MEQPFLDAAVIVSALIGALLAFLSTSLSTWFGVVIERDIRVKKEERLLASELKDVRRHYLANLEILDNIDLAKGIPSTMHFSKMKVMDTSILLSPETFRNISIKHSKLIYRLKTLIINFNIEIERVVKYIDDDHVDISLLQSYIEYLGEKLMYMVDRLDYEFTHFGNVFKPKFDGNKRPKQIVYHEISNYNTSLPVKRDKIGKYLELNKSSFRDINDN